MQPFQQAFTDMFKGFGEFKAPVMDFNNLFAMQRRNMEALATANQIVAENAQAISRQQAEALRSGVETFLKTTKDIMTGGSPEENTAKQAELARSAIDSSVSNLRDTIDSVTKSQFEAFDVLQKRLADTLEEVSSIAPRKKAA